MTLNKILREYKYTYVINKSLSKQNLNMEWKKEKIELIENKKSRIETFTERKKVMFQKLDEIAKLCDVKVCAIVCGPENQVPEVWPPGTSVQDVFEDMSLNLKNVLDQDRYMCERIPKAKEKLRKLSEKKTELRMRDIMFNCLNRDYDEYSRLNQSELQDFMSFIGEDVKKIKKLQYDSQLFYDFYDKNPHMSQNNSNQNMSFDMNQNLGQNFDHNSDEEQSFADLVDELFRDTREHVNVLFMDGADHNQPPTTGHISSTVAVDAGENVDTLFMDDNSHHQPPTSNSVTTGHIPSTAATAVDANAAAPNIINKV